MFPTDARPGAPEERSAAARPLPVLGSIGVAGATAAIVFACGVYIVEVHGAGTPEEPRTVAVTTAARGVARATRARRGAPAETVAGPAPHVSAASAPAPALAAAPSPSGLAASPPPATEAPAAPEDAPAAPREGYGALKVSSARDATVYVTGVAVGPTDRVVEARCGRAFVRLGEPSPHGTRWLSKGRTVVIKCGALTEVGF
jgi:hypothetical protein